MVNLEDRWLPNVSEKCLTGAIIRDDRILMALTIKTHGDTELTFIFKLELWDSFSLPLVLNFLAFCTFASSTSKSSCFLLAGQNRLEELKNGSYGSGMQGENML